MNTTTQITTAEALNALQLLTAYVLQIMRHTLTTCRRLALNVREWLNTRHDFSNEEGEIHLTGWQCIGFAFAVCAFALLVSIDWDRTLASL